MRVRLAVVLPLAVLAAWLIVASRGTNVPERGTADGLRADLRQLAAAQEIYKADFGHYAASYEELRAHHDTLNGGLSLRSSVGATQRVTYADSMGFAAIARVEPQVLRCWIYVGPRREQPASEEAGTPYCNGER